MIESAYRFVFLWGIRIVLLLVLASAIAVLARFLMRG